MKKGIVMRLQCEECGEWHDIPNDKMDDYNIYRKWTSIGSAAACKPCLLCRKCTDKVLAGINLTPSPYGLTNGV